MRRVTNTTGRRVGIVTLELTTTLAHATVGGHSQLYTRALLGRIQVEQIRPARERLAVTKRHKCDDESVFQMEAIVGYLACLLLGPKKYLAMARFVLPFGLRMRLAFNLPTPYVL